MNPVEELSIEFVEHAAELIPPATKAAEIFPQWANYSVQLIVILPAISGQKLHPLLCIPEGYECSHSRYVGGFMLAPNWGMRKAITLPINPKRVSTFHYSSEQIVGITEAEAKAKTSKQISEYLHILRSVKDYNSKPKPTITTYRI